MTATVLPVLLATYTRDPSGVTATPRGPPPTGTVALTVFVAASITATVLLSSFATYTRDPSGAAATATGPRPVIPKSTLAATVFVAVSMTDTRVPGASTSPGATT